MVILTGGAGFIGSAFLEKLNAEGIDDILIVDNLGSGDKWMNLSGKRFSDFEHKTSFLDILESLPVKDITHIIHLGACSSTTETNADYMLQNNFQFTKTLAEFALLHKIKFIYASSAATYGDGALGFADDDKLCFQYKALNVYAYSKLLFDQWAIGTGASKKITGVRFFNVFGPNEAHKADMRSVVQKSYEQIKKQGTVTLFKSYLPNYQDGEQLRDFIYVKDCSDVLWWMFESSKAKGIYNLGTGTARSWKDLVNAVFAALQLTPKIEFIEMPETLQKRYQYFTQAEMGKLLAAGYSKPFTTLEDGVKDYVVNYLEAGKRL